MLVHRYLQSETTECGLAALAMAAGSLGSEVDLAWLRDRYSSSARGTSVKQLCTIAADLQLIPHAVRVELSELGALRTPSILFWQFDHFIVYLGRIRGGYRVFDPAVGLRLLKKDEVSAGFTGIAIELSPGPLFKRQRARPGFKIQSIIRFPHHEVRKIVNILFLSVLIEVYALVSPLFLQLTVDNVLTRSDLSLLWALSVGFGLLAIADTIGETLRNILVADLSSFLNWDMTTRVFHHLIRLPLLWFKRRSLADVLTRFQAIESIRSLLANGVVTVVVDGFLVFATLALMFRLSAWVTVVVLITSGLSAGMKLVMLRFSIPASAAALSATIAEQNRRIECVRAIQTVKAVGGEINRENAWAGKFLSVVDTGRSVTILGGLTRSLDSLIDSLGLIIVVGLGALEVSHRVISIGLLFALVSYRGQTSRRLSSLFDLFQEWRMSGVYTSRISDIVQTDPEEVSGANRTGIERLSGSLTIRNLSFRHSDADPVLFHSVNASVAAGEFVAIVGPSGVGKSSLLKVIGGIFPPLQGQVLFDGFSASAWGTQSIREAVGLVLQDDELFAGSIRENVAFFDSTVDSERVWHSLSLACLDEDVKKMPGGIQTYVGESGSNLSAGQKQRLLIARALYRMPRILILDEATSNLDLDTEKRLANKLRELGVTRIVVAHRPQAITGADQVLAFTTSGLIRLKGPSTL